MFQFDPEGFGEIPWTDFRQTLQHPDFVSQVPPHKREVLLLKISKICKLFLDYYYIITRWPVRLLRTVSLTGKLISLKKRNI